MQQMKAWVYHPLTPSTNGDIAIQLERVPVPQAGTGEVLLRVVKTSVCGTDETLFAGGLSRVPDGVIPGHEICGEVVETGSDVQGLRQGDIVAVESHYSLPGAIDEGIIGLWPPRDAQRRDLKTYHGGYAEYCCIPAACAHPLPASLASGDFWPSLFEPAGNDFLLAREVMKLNPRRVAVFGCGPHGLYAQVFLKYFGTPQIVAFEKDPMRADFARRLGCVEAVLDPSNPDVGRQVHQLTGGQWFDVGIDMVGKSGQALASACEFTRPGGTVVLFGLFVGDYEINGQSANDLIFSRASAAVDHQGKALQVIGVTGREGIWPDLISTVSESLELQQQLMKPVTVVGHLEELGRHIRTRRPDLLKAAFYPFS